MDLFLTPSKYKFLIQDIIKQKCPLIKPLKYIIINYLMYSITINQQIREMEVLASFWRNSNKTEKEKYQKIQIWYRHPIYHKEHDWTVICSGYDGWCDFVCIDCPLNFTF
jgi:hypothetical protein